MCGRAFFEYEALPPQKIPTREDPSLSLGRKETPKVQEAPKPRVDFREMVPFGCHRFTLPHRMR